MIHGRAARIGDADDDVLVFFAEKGRDTDYRAACADRADKAVDTAVAIFPDLRARGNIMGLAVIQVIPLIGEDYAILLYLLQLLGKPPANMLVIVWIGIGDARHLDQLRAAQAEQVFFFLALRLRDNNERAVAARIRDKSKADTGVAGGRFNHESAGAKFATLLCLKNHLPARPVFDRAARVHEFGLAKDRASRLFGSALELDQGRMADGVDSVVTDLHARFRDW